jgi:hypothetical protein
LPLDRPFLFGRSGVFPSASPPEPSARSSIGSPAVPAIDVFIHDCSVGESERVHDLSRSFDTLLIDEILEAWPGLMD